MWTDSHGKPDDLDAMLEQCDFVSIHTVLIKSKDPRLQGQGKGVIYA
jgi:phosphoglycerate dehydrogenase-like enzyme